MKISFATPKRNRNKFVEKFDEHGTLIDTRLFIYVRLDRGDISIERLCSNLHRNDDGAVLEHRATVRGRRWKERERAKERRANRGDISHAREHMLEPVTTKYIGKDRTRCVPDESTFPGCVRRRRIRPNTFLFSFISLSPDDRFSYVCITH